MPHTNSSFLLSIKDSEPQDIYSERCEAFQHYRLVMIPKAQDYLYAIQLQQIVLSAAASAVYSFGINYLL